MFSENLAHFLRGPSPAVAQMRPGVVVVQKSATESLKVRHGPGVWRAGLAATPGTASTLSLCFWTRRSSRAAGADSGRHFHKPYWGDVETCVEYLWNICGACLRCVCHHVGNGGERQGQRSMGGRRRGCSRGWLAGRGRAEGSPGRGAFHVGGVGCSLGGRGKVCECDCGFALLEGGGMGLFSGWGG